MSPGMSRASTPHPGDQTGEPDLNSLKSEAPPKAQLAPSAYKDLSEPALPTRSKLTPH